MAPFERLSVWLFLAAGLCLCWQNAHAHFDGQGPRDRHFYTYINPTDFARRTPEDSCKAYMDATFPSNYGGRVDSVTWSGGYTTDGYPNYTCTMFFQLLNQSQTVIIRERHCTYTKDFTDGTGCQPANNACSLRENQTSSYETTESGGWAQYRNMAPDGSSPEEDGPLCVFERIGAMPHSTKPLCWVVTYRNLGGKEHDQIGRTNPTNGTTVYPGIPPGNSKGCGTDPNSGFEIPKTDQACDSQLGNVTKYIGVYLAQGEAPPRSVCLLNCKAYFSDVANASGDTSMDRVVQVGPPEIRRRMFAYRWPSSLDNVVPGDPNAGSYPAPEVCDGTEDWTATEQASGVTPAGMPCTGCDPSAIYSDTVPTSGSPAANDSERLDRIKTAVDNVRNAVRTAMLENALGTAAIVGAIKAWGGGGGGGTGGGGDGESSVEGGDACDTPPACSGDAVQCAILRQEWKQRCDGVPEFSKEGVLSDAGLDGVDGSALATGGGGNVANLIAQGSSWLGGSSECFAPITLSMGPTLGGDLTVDTASICTTLSIAGFMLLAGAYVMAAKIVVGGF